VAEERIGVERTGKQKMKTALVATTIHVPRILDLLRRYDPDVRFFIAGDQKSPDAGMLEWMSGMDNAVWLSADSQKYLGYKCSELIGWDCIQRRSIAILEAVKWGAEIIITHDDDNIAMSSDYFDNFTGILSSVHATGGTFDGLQIGQRNAWTDIGQLAYPRHEFKPVVQRGTPQARLTDERISFITDARIGLAQGIILGEPDTSAIDRISRVYPQIHQISEVLREGVVLAMGGFAAVNSQNTAFLRKFAPTMFMAPGLGRADDIVAGLLTETAMAAQGYQVHFGRPFCFQSRNEHDLVKDLKDEMWMIEHIGEVANYLLRMPPRSTALEMAQDFYAGCDIIPEQTREAGLAWCDDIEGLL
jgi:hypothetical protein